MSQEDFDLESLGEYLHIDPARLARLAERGKLPARRVAGQWRFSRPEISLWLEEQIGLSDEARLAEMESALESGPAAEDDNFARVYELLPLAAMAVPMAARTRNSAVDELVAQAANTGWLWNTERMTAAIWAREQLHPTALENGVALLHPRRPMSDLLDRPFVAFGRTPAGIPFSAPHGRLTDLFFLLCSVNDRGHLHALARLSRLVANHEFLSELRAAPDARTAHDCIAQREEALLG